MPDEQNQTQTGDDASQQLIVPADVREKFPELTELILHSESMNDGERQYWFDILPVMSAEQTEQLRTILQNEKDQLAAIDAKYGKEIDAITQRQKPLEEIEKSRKTRANKRSEAEESTKKAEEEAEEDLLKKIEEA